MFTISSWIIEFLILITITTFLAYKYFTRHYDYFKKRNVHYTKPTPLIGNMWPVLSMKLTIGEWLRGLYNTTDAPYFGIFLFDEPCLVIKSPELIKHILIKDFNYFYDRTVLASKNELTSNMLFWQKNPDWKSIRTKMTPVFSSGKLKGMFSSINEVGMDLNRYIRKNVGQLESKEIFAKFATDVIAKCAFAIKAGSFEEENPEFRKVGRAFFEFNWRNGIIQSSYFFRQKWASALQLNFFEKWATEYLNNVFSFTISNRAESNMKGHDLVDILVEMRKNKDLDGDAVVAQAVQFFIASFETTSSTMSFALYELCLQPEIQDKLREEVINSIGKYGGITYEGLKEMRYMEMCVLETLRKYPVLPFLDRRCNADCRIDGIDLVIEKGMPVYIPLMALHYDEKYFPEPEKYDPERFAVKNSHNLTGLYYLPFGEGPRICIGQRFGMLAVKIGLTHILSEFVIERTSETPVPVKFAARSFLLQSDVGLPMKFTKVPPTAL
nr:cytochrome P450 [Pharsalia antennata]